MEIFNGSDDEVIGRLAEVAIVATNKKQAKAIRATGHLPKELDRLVAGYSAIDERIVRAIYDDCKGDVERSFVLNGERWEISLDWQYAGYPKIDVRCGHVCTSTVTRRHDLCRFLFGDILSDKLEYLKGRLRINYKAIDTWNDLEAKDEHLASVSAAARLAIYDGLLEQYARLAGPSS